MAILAALPARHAAVTQIMSFSPHATEPPSKSPSSSAHVQPTPCATPAGAFAPTVHDEHVSPARVVKSVFMPEAMFWQAVLTGLNSGYASSAAPFHPGRLSIPAGPAGAAGG